VSEPGAGLLSVFERIAVINLVERRDRRREMAQELARIGLGFEHPSVALFPAERPSGPGGFPSVGARGCFESHHAILRAARDEGVGSVLILEDDASFAEGIDARAAEVVPVLAREPWDIFYGGWYGYRPPPGSRPVHAPPPDALMSTTHMIGLRGPAIAEAVAFLDALLARPPGDPEGGPMHVDGAYGWYRRSHPERRTLIAVPPLADQRSSPSDVYARGLARHLRLPGAVTRRLRGLRRLVEGAGRRR